MYQDNYPTENNSPSQTFAYSEYGISPIIDREITHQQAPNVSAGIPDVKIPRPPDPTVGGEPGRSHALGWTRGLNPFRFMHQRFTGRTLVVPSMGVHPQEGPVGFSSRLDRLADRRAALESDYTPTPEQVARIFTGGGRNANPILKEMGYQNDNS